MTASLAVSRQMLHSNVLSWPPLSPAPLLLPLGPPALELSGDAEAEGPLLAILGCQQARGEDSPQGNPHRNEAEEGKRESHIPEGTTRERELVKKSLCSTLAFSSQVLEKTAGMHNLPPLSL